MLNISYDYQEQVGVISDRRLNISEEPRVPFFFFLIFFWISLDYRLTKPPY